MLRTPFSISVALLIALAIALSVHGDRVLASGGGGGGHGGGGGGGGHGGGGFSGGGFSSGGYGSFGGGHSGYSGGFNSGHFSPGSASHGGGQWNGHGSSGFSSHGAGHYVGPGRYSYGHHDWDRYYGHYHHYLYFWGFGWPYWGFDLGFFYPFYPYVYTYGVYPYDCYNGYVYQYGSFDASLATAADQTTADPPVSVTAAYPPQSDQTAVRTMDADALQFYASGRAAFLKGDYREALRQGSHAAVEAPQNPKVHELMSLALLGLSDYRGAATEAHASLVMGPVSDWPTLLDYYGDAEKYTSQLRTLEKYVGDNPTSAPGRFLLGYQYLLTGNRDEAKKQMAEAIKLTPKDKLAEYVLKQLEAGQPITPPPASPAPKTTLPPPPAPAPDLSPTPPAKTPKEPQSSKSDAPKEL